MLKVEYGILIEESTAISLGDDLPVERVEGWVVHGVRVFPGDFKAVAFAGAV